MDNALHRAVAAIRDSITWMNKVDLVDAARRWMAGNRLLACALLLTILVCCGIWQMVPYLNGPPEWYWRYDCRLDFWSSWRQALRWMVLGAAVIGIPFCLLRLFVRSAFARQLIGLSALLIWGIFYHTVSFITATPLGLEHLASVVVNPTKTSYYTVAQWIDTEKLPPLNETLRRYPELLPIFPLHASTHPPGCVLVSYGLHRTFESNPRLCRVALKFFERLGVNSNAIGKHPPADLAATTTLGFMLMAGGLLTIFPLFFLILRGNSASTVTNRVAWGAAFLWVHYPALIIFEPEFDQIYPVLTLLCFYVASRGLRKDPVTCGVALGGLFMACLLLSFTMSFIIPMLCAIAWLDRVRLDRSWHPLFLPHRSAWKLIATTVVTALVTELFLRKAFGINLTRTLLESIQQSDHRVPRTYLTWVIYNVYDFLFFGGITLSTLAVVYCFQTAPLGCNRPRLIAPAWVAFPIGVLLLNLTGLTPAETGRIWLFLAPGLVWAGAAYLARRSRSWWSVNLLIVLLAQSAFLYICRTKMSFLTW